MKQLIKEIAEIPGLAIRETFGYLLLSFKITAIPLFFACLINLWRVFYV